MKNIDFTNYLVNEYFNEFNLQKPVYIHSSSFSIDVMQLSEQYLNILSIKKSSQQHYSSQKYDYKRAI